MARERSVRLSHQAEKALHAIETRYQTHLSEAIRDLADNPLAGKKLKGEFEGLRSHRIGPFRIIYRFFATLVEVVSVDHRKDVYR